MSHWNLGGQKNFPTSLLCIYFWIKKSTSNAIDSCDKIIKESLQAIGNIWRNSLWMGNKALCIVSW